MRSTTHNVALRDVFQSEAGLDQRKVVAMDRPLPDEGSKGGDKLYVLVFRVVVPQCPKCCRVGKLCLGQWLGRSGILAIRQPARSAVVATNPTRFDPR